MHPALVIAAAAHHSNHAGHLSWFQAIVLGALQGVTELFPISSLGHGVVLKHYSAGLLIIAASIPTILRYFRACTLTPFGLYCLGFGLAMTIYTTV